MTLPSEERAEAHDELLAQFAYYNDRRDGLGFEFLDAVDGAIKSIVDWPDAWSPYEFRADPVIRAKGIEGFPFRVIYFVDRETERGEGEVRKRGSPILSSSVGQLTGQASGPSADRGHGRRGRCWRGLQGLRPRRP